MHYIPNQNRNNGIIEPVLRTSKKLRAGVKASGIYIRGRHDQIFSASNRFFIFYGDLPESDSCIP